MDTAGNQGTTPTICRRCGDAEPPVWMTLRIAMGLGRAPLDRHAAIIADMAGVSLELATEYVRHLHGKCTKRTVTCPKCGGELPALRTRRCPHCP